MAGSCGQRHLLDSQSPWCRGRRKACHVCSQDTVNTYWPSSLCNNIWVVPGVRMRCSSWISRYVVDRISRSANDLLCTPHLLNRQKRGSQRLGIPGVVQVANQLPRACQPAAGCAFTSSQRCLWEKPLLNLAHADQISFNLAPDFEWAIRHSATESLGLGRGC